MLYFDDAFIKKEFYESFALNFKDQESINGEIFKDFTKFNNFILSSRTLNFFKKAGFLNKEYSKVEIIKQQQKGDFLIFDISIDSKIDIVFFITYNKIPERVIIYIKNIKTFISGFLKDGRLIRKKIEVIQ
jgi:hypothetical protein